MKCVPAGLTQRSTWAWMQRKQEKKDQYKYVSDIWSKYFYDKSTLNKHIKNHSYKCDECNKMFKSENNLK